MEGIKNILIVDDSSTNVMLLEAVLSEMGYRAYTATCGKEALHLMEKNTFHLMVLDLIMPKMSGMELLSIVRSNPDTQKLPVIVVSGISNETEIRNVKSVSDVVFIQKPVDIQLISNTVSYLLR